VEQKAKQIALYMDSYLLHDAKCSEIMKTLAPEFTKLNKKMGRVSAATQDRAGANTIQSSINQQLQFLDAGHAQLGQRIQAINYYVANPDKKPQELKGPS